MQFIILWALLLVSNLFSCETCVPQQKLLIIDTDGSQEYYYRNTMLLARSVGFDVNFLNLYDLLEGAQISSYDNVLIFLSSALFKNINHEISQKLIKIFEDFACMQNKFIGILLPSLRLSDASLHAAIILLERLGIFKNEQCIITRDAPLRPVVYSFLKYILQPDEKVGSLFGTTLVNPQTKAYEKFIETSSRAIIDEDTGITVFKSLPGNRSFTQEVIQTFPLGMYLKDQESNNTFLISKASVFNFADIAENFWRVPMQIEKRNELLMAAQQVLWEIYITLKNGNMPLTTSGLRPPLPTILQPSFIQQEKIRVHHEICERLKRSETFGWMCTEGIKAGWLEPSDYFLSSDKDQLTALATKSFAEVELLKKQALDRGINFIYDSGLNLLWFEFNPEVFIGENAIWKEEKKNFIENTLTIMNALKEKFKKAKKPMPKIFIGTDITTNYKHQRVPCVTKDVFGNEYNKIPCPLDFKDFWQKELLDTFDTFYDMFYQEMPIDGIFLDFEMYHAPQQAGSYTDLMDFSDLSWKLYCDHTRNGQENLSTVDQRVKYLAQQQEFDDYFNFLEETARNIGKRIKDHIAVTNPDLLIGAYAPTLPSSWFYRGMLSGLSSKDKPLILATFNVDYYSHYQWFTNHEIFILHGIPILLSKFKSSKDLVLIEELLKYHDFVWFNRPSRQIYSNVKNRTWSIEASEMKSEELAPGIRQKYEKVQKSNSSSKP